MHAFNLFDSLGFLLINTAFHIKQQANTMLFQRGCQITVDQYLILEMVGQQEGLTQTALCESTCKNNSNLTRILLGMEKKGLIYREKGSDARSRVVYLTPDGKQARAQTGEMVRAYQTAVADRLTAQEQAQLSAILQKLREGAEQ